MTEVGSVPVYRGNLEKLMRKIMQERGLDLSQYRRAYVERRLTARLRTLGLNTYRQYSYLLDSDPAEYDHLVNTLTINVTDFFRDGPVWDVLKHQVLPELIAEKRRGRSRTIRVWSAGCATGEEPYSLAMAMRDVLGDNADEFLISVIGTDLDPKALAFAARGVYDSEKLGRIPQSYQVRFVRMSGVSEFEILPEVRRLVRFTPYNLFDGAPMRVVDLILCRNVFIYFDRGQQAKVLGNFWDAMCRGGYLVLGRSEKLSSDASDRFEHIDGKERIYRKPARLH